MSRKKGLKPAQLKMLFNNLEMILHSGLPLSEGFDILLSSEDDATARALFARLHSAASDGGSLAEAFKESEVVPEYAVSLIAIGEKTGQLEESFSALANFYGKRDELSQSIRSSVVYPVSMLMMVVLVVAVLLVQVMPVFDHVFRQLGYEMTGVSAALLNMGTALGQAGFWIALVVLALVVIGTILAVTPAGRRFYATLFQSAPLTRDISLSLSAQRFSLAMSSLLSAGLEIDEALGYAETLVDDKRALRSVKSIREAVSSGATFLTALEKSGLYSQRDRALLSVGIKTGVDAEALDQVGEQITVETENRLSRLVAAIEPTLVAIMCVLVGVILLSVMLPLMSALTGF